jgi:hypothetical protein
MLLGLARENGVVVVHLEDAIACLEADVLRPATVMLGLASEETIRVAYAALAHTNAVKPASSFSNLRELLAALTVAPTKTKDEAHRLGAALAALEVVRVERNNASHPGTRITDRTHVESLLATSSHHLASLWEIVVKPSTTTGFVPG